MIVIICKDYEGMSRKAASIVASAIRKKPALTLGLATGATPRGTYKELIRLHKQESLDFSQVKTFNLDEYLGLSPSHPQSFYHQIHDAFLNHINIIPRNTHIPDGTIDRDFDSYCEKYESSIRNAGGIDLQILGIGKTGHIGFNEPTSSLASRTRLKTLTQETIAANQASFGPSERVPDCAITMGIGTILESSRILLLASGLEKANAVAAAIEGPLSASVSASALQLHKDVVVILDQEAAVKLRHQDYYNKVYEMTERLTPNRLE
jgi:glucosamine-6-phosphate deaminase